MNNERATTSTLAKGDVLGDQTATTAVKYLDLSPLFTEGEREVYVRFVCTVDAYVALVEDATPETTPTITDVSGDAAMDLIPAGHPEFFVVTPADAFLAYSSDAGIVRVRRASPRY